MTFQNTTIKTTVVALVLGMFLIQSLLMPLAAFAEKHEETPTTQKQAQEQGEKKAQEDASAPPAPAGSLDQFSRTEKCRVWSAKFIECGIAKVASWVLSLAGVALTLAGLAFDAVAAVTLRGEAYSLTPIYTGWGIARDTANLFFIIILLIIAIATVLRNMTYGAKQLLLKLVLVAIFINFSLLLTQVVIDFTNSLALQFYNSIGEESTEIEVGALEGNKIETVRESRSLSATFVEGLNPQNIFAGYKTTDDDPGFVNALFQITIAAIGGIILVLSAAFVLAAAAFLMLARYVILLFLMILAPIAFMFIILPQTSGYAKKWWDKLFQQAFFAPAFMFLFYIVALISSKGVLGDPHVFGVQPTAGGGFRDGAIRDIRFILLYITLIMMMGATLMIARTMGVLGAAGALKLWGAGTGKLIGWGKALSLAPVRGAARFAAGKAAGRFAAPSRAVGAGLERLAARMPRLGGAIASTILAGTAVGGMAGVWKRRADFIKRLPKERRAEYFANSSAQVQELIAREALSTRELAEMYEGASPTSADAITSQLHHPSFSVERREAFYNDLARRYDRADPAARAQIVNTLQRRLSGREQEVAFREIAKTELAKPVGDLARDIHGFADELKTAIFTSVSKEDLQRLAKLSTPANQRALVSNLARLLPTRRDKFDDILGVIPQYANIIPGGTVNDLFQRGKVDMANITIAEANAVMPQMILQAKQQDIEAILRRSDQVTADYLARLKALGTGATGIANALEAAGNTGTANVIRTNKILQSMLGL